MRNYKRTTPNTPEIRLAATPSNLTATSSWNPEALLTAAAIFALLGLAAHALQARPH